MVVSQEGLREVFEPSDDLFVLADGGTFNVLKGVESTYTFVEFIESTGTQYIDTGFKNNQDSRIVMDVQVVAKPRTNAWLFGGKNSTTNGARNVFLQNGSSWAVDYNSDNTRITLSGVDILTRLNVDFNKNTVTINEQSYSFKAATFQCNYNHYLFAQNKIGEVSGYISARLYSCQIYDNDVLVRDFIPVRVKDSGEYGLLDNVNNVFYGSASNTQFIGG